MGSQDLSLKVLLSAVDSGASSMVRGLGRAFGGLSSPAGLAAAGLLAVASAAAAVAVKTVQAAANWQTSLTQLVTGAGESQSNLAMVSNGMLQMAVDTGTTTKQLSAGMYQIESAGYHGANGLQVLQSAAEGAKVGNADLAAVANGTTTALTDYGMAASQSASVVNDLIATVANGKTTMQALSTSLASILPVSSATGVSLKDTSAALATMTGEGVPAAQAATFLRQTLLALNAPTTAASKQLAEVGLTTQQISDKMKQSLPAALQMITDAVGKKFPPGSAKYIAALKNIVGGSKNLQGTLDLTGSHMKTFKSNVGAISTAVQKGGKSITGWALVQQTFNQKMSQAKEAVETLGIKIGQALLPTVTTLLSNVLPIISHFATWIINSGILQKGLTVLGNIIKGVSGFVGGLISGIGKVITFFKNNQIAALALLIPLGMLSAILISMGVAAIPGILLTIGTLITGFISWAAAAGAAAIATLAATWPILAIGAAIGLLIGLVILIIQHWSGIAAFFEGLWNRVKAIFWVTVAVLQQVWNNIISSLHNAWNNIVGFIKDALQRLWNTFTAPFRAIGALFQWLYNHNTYFKKLVDKIHQIVVIALAILHNIWQKAIDFIVGLWTGLVSKATGAWNAVTGAIQKGVNFVVGWVRAQIQQHIEDIRQKWFMLSAIVGQAWAKVQSVISGAWNNYIVKPLQSLWNNIVNFANGWPKQALQWGINMVQGFINGITGMLGNVKNAAGNIIGSVGKLLGFHSPAKEGPGMHIIEWGAGMVAGFSSGVIGAIPTLQAAVNLAVNRGIASPLSPPALSGAIPYGRPPMGNSYSNSNYAGGNTHNGDIIIHAPAGMNVKALADEIERRQNQKYRRSGLMGNLAAGARNS